MAKTPSLLDLLKLVPASELARAADALGVGPEALKKKIMSLESVLGTSFVDTATKALKPGEAGRLVIDHASRIFSQARDLTRDLEELAGLQAPELHFGTDMFAAELPLGAALGRMASANSRLRVRAVTADFEHLAREVLAGKLEFAIADTTSAERHPTRLAIEPVAEHRLFFFVRQGHPLAAATPQSLETILVFPVVAPRLPQRIGAHIVKSLPQARIDRETGDLLPNLLLDTFAVARNLVLAGDAVGLAPLGALENDLRTRRLTLVAFTAPWLNLNYGLFYPRKRALSRVAQLFMTQLRQVETAIQAREQRALSRLSERKRPRRTGTRKATARSPRKSVAGRRHDENDFQPHYTDPQVTRLFPLLLAACMTAATAVAAPPATPATANATAPATYRLDLFHTGGKGVEIFAVDRLRLEPLPWPGHPARLSDDGQAGLYRYEVRDAAGTVLRAQGYASVAGEWLTTDEAQKSYRTFTESLRFPAPTAKGPVQVRLFKRDAKQVFQPLWETAVDTTDMLVDRTPAAEQTLVHLEVHGAPADKVDLLLLGDGYTASECGAKFPADAQRMMAALFREQPFARRRNDFNVWGLCPPSAASGISRPSTGVQHKTPVGATYDAFGSERYVLTFDDRALREVASRAPYEAIVILANGNTYGGGGIFNDFSTVAVDSAWAEYIFVHELGHHFAALADEYYTSPVAYAPVTEVVEPWEPNVTALLDRDRLKWRHLVERSTPVPTPWPKAKFEEFSRDIQQRRKQIREDRRPESDMDALFREEQAWLTKLFARTPHRNAVGAFQGANYDAQAYYRPQLDCIMFTRDDVPFCKVCEAALEHVIDSIAGKTAQP